MGIYGFTLYMHNNESKYLEPFELHNTQLVVDGISTATKLYQTLENPHGIFGGDYDRFFNHCEQFIDDLLACNIRPLVIFDGGMEDKKLDTIVTRIEQKTKLFLNPSQFLVNSLYPGPGKVTIGPIFVTKVLIKVLEKKNIPYAKTMFEADNAIASIARILNCPVLSLDSDFFIFGVLYIPFDTMQAGVQQNKNGNTVKHCKLFRFEKLLQRFGGSEVSVLPLAGVLLGNDYIKSDTCENFHSIMEQGNFPLCFQNRMGKRLLRIERTLQWLSPRSFDTAAREIISTFPKDNCKEVMNGIECVVRDYNYIPMDTMKAFGYDEKFITEKSQSLMIRGSFINNSMIDSHEIENESKGVGGITVKDLPAWFIQDFVGGKYSGFVLDTLMRRLYTSTVQVDVTLGKVLDTVIIPVLKLLYSLLVSGYQREEEYLTHITFDKDVRLKYSRIEYQNTIFNCKIPHLKNLRELPFSMRTKMLQHALTIDTNDLDNFPPWWKLYVGVIVYWKKQKEETIASMVHVHSLLFSLLFGVVDEKIGYQRCSKEFNKRYKNTPKSTKQTYSVPNTVIQAYNEVSPEDCMLIAPFFMQRFKINYNLVQVPQNLNSSRVYGIFQFQTCLLMFSSLNSLLGHPYDDIAIEKCLNGTLFYNLCGEFQSQSNIMRFINNVLCNYPSLLRLYKILWDTVEALCCA